jgi:hypothetical protein
MMESTGASALPTAPAAPALAPAAPRKPAVPWFAPPVSPHSLGSSGPSALPPAPEAPPAPAPPFPEAPADPPDPPDPPAPPAPADPAAPAPAAPAPVAPAEPPAPALPPAAVQVPIRQTPLLHEAPSGFSASGGQACMAPSQLSSASHGPAASRQGVPTGSASSAGHEGDAPSQLSGLSQMSPEGRHRVDAASGEQAPETAAPAATLQAWQSAASPASPAPQAESQQTPSAQNPEAHSIADGQGSPRGRCAWQCLLASQKKPWPQTASVSQVIGQAESTPSQSTPPGQLGAPVVPAGTTVQLPAGLAGLAQLSHAPLHAESQQTPSAQKPVAHSPEAAQGKPTASRHAEAALQILSPEQVSVSTASATGRQVPGVTEQERQGASQADSQQTPSAQKPAAHSPGAAQGCPSAGRQAPWALQAELPEQVSGSC